MPEPEDETATTPPDPGERADAPAPLADALGQVVRRVLWHGRRGLNRAANTGRLRLEMRQVQRDRDHFWIRLGKTAYRLAEAGEIDHPALRKAMDRLDELEARLEVLERQRAGDAEEIG